MTSSSTMQSRGTVRPSAFAPAAGPSEILPLAAVRWPSRVALVAGGVRLTYRDLEQRSRTVAVALQQRGIGPGSVVSLFGQNSWEWLVGYHGALRAGAVVNPVNVMLTAPELAYVLNDCGSSALICGADQVSTAQAALAEASQAGLFITIGQSVDGAVDFAELASSANDIRLKQVTPEPTGLCAIAYTSGTTGHPKGAMQSHESILLNCAYTAAMHHRTADEVVVTALPAAHVYGNVAINSTFLVGGTVVLMPRFSSAAALELIESERATMFEGVPAMYSMLLADPAIDSADLSSLRKSTVGGQTFSVDLLYAWQRRAGVPMLELWGMTELSGLGTTHGAYAPALPGSIGVSLPGVQVRIGALDGAERELPAGEHGELQVRGPLVMLGYYGNPAATAEAIMASGWLRTGDVAYRDESGHFFVVDRLKDMIITGGYNVYPAEIERVLAAHPEVVMVAVGRRADPVLGEIAVAFVVAKPGAELSEESVLEFCQSRLAAYKRPRAVVFVDQLPTTSSGKLMRRKLGDLDTPVTSSA